MEWKWELVSGKGSVCIIHSLRGTNTSGKQCNITCIVGNTALVYATTKQNISLALYLPDCHRFSPLSLFPHYLKIARDIPITMKDVVCRKQSVLLFCCYLVIIQYSLKRAIYRAWKGQAQTCVSAGGQDRAFISSPLWYQNENTCDMTCLPL